MRFLETSEIHSALQKAAKRSPRDYLIISIFAKTGMRVSEISRIKLQDILEEAEQIVVRGKGDKIRNVDITADLIMQMINFAKINKIRKNQELLQISIRRLQQICNEIADANAHAFRHSYAIHLLRKTKNIRYVQKQLGHSSLATTQIYLQFMEFEDEKRKLGELYHERKEKSFLA